ncbi:hypothetical protein [Serratia quinivorans]|uniref:MrpH family fimbial adhesin n=1 Tax=Serratia quinivorans TaxID=137545 RepID=UPI00217C8894|nr:hypothetical protein [Serratia quinivorans]CAI1094347.1 Uncharacterised protein [Serratia quinivorans]CAI2069027.1 Uncharacterised protein [Serratia quinivorans]
MLILRCALFGLLLLVGLSAQGGSLGYITKIEDKGTGDNRFNIWFTIAYFDENDPTSNPCYGSSYCSYKFTIGVPNKRGGRYSLVVMNRRYTVNASNFKTMGEVAASFKSNVSLPLSDVATATTWGTVSSKFREEAACFGLFSLTPPGAGTIITGSQGTPAPGSICGIAPPPVGVCKLVGDIILDHGTVNSDKINGNQATTTAYLECSQAMSIKVTAMGMGAQDVTLRVDGSLSASLQVNGVAGKTGANVDVPANTRTPVKFISVLKTKGAVAAGPFSGSGTAVLSIP